MSSISRILADDPELTDGLTGERLNAAIRDCVAGTWECPAGAVVAAGGVGDMSFGIGLLILDGLVARRVGVAGRFGAELLGDGDLMNPFHRADMGTSLPRTGKWRVLRPSRMAILDSEFALRATRYPEVVSALVTRALRRSRHIATNMAIVQQPRIDLRLHMLFWELADRWGTVHQDGVHVRLQSDALDAVRPRRRAPADGHQGARRARGAVGRGVDRDRLAAPRRAARRARRPRLADDRRSRVGRSVRAPASRVCKASDRFGQRRRTAHSPPRGPSLPERRGPLVDDLSLPGALHLTFVRSYMAHAKVNGIDKSAAEAAGAQVFVAADTDLSVNPPPPFIPIDPQMFRPLLASDTVRFVGDIVAIVLADSREASVDAAELVDGRLRPAAAVTDPEEAAARRDRDLPRRRDERLPRVPPQEADPNLFDSSDVVVKGKVISQRLAACPIEPRSSAAQWGEDGRLTLWIYSQTPHQDKMVLGLLLGLEPENVRVVAPDVGGGFGAKGIAVEDVIVGWAARATGKPVRWTETRSENMVAMHHGRASVLSFELGASRDGKIDALRLNIVADAGAYPGIGAFLPNLTAMMASGVYEIPKIEIDIKAVVTNTTPIGPVRGAGRPEATQMLERAIDLLAAELSLDPAEVRRRNFIPNDAFPYTTASGANYDIGDFGGALDLALESAGLREAAPRAGQPARERRRAPARDRPERVRRGHERDLRERVRRGRDHRDGRGDRAHRLVLPGPGPRDDVRADRVRAARNPDREDHRLKGDTDVVPRGTGTYGSKSTQIGGVAAGKASEEVVEIGKRLAAAELEAAPEDMVLDVDQGRFHVTGAPSPALSWGDLASRLESEGRLGELAAEVDFQAAQPTFPFGAHVAVVEVDTETGAVELTRMVAVDDAGRIINPLVAEGQVHGGVVAGIAQALYEELTYDAEGNPQNGNLVTYGIPAATELPAIEVVGMETPTPINPLGVKGIGESGTIGATPAVHNAVIDALSPYRRTPHRHAGQRRDSVASDPGRPQRARSGPPLAGAPPRRRHLGCYPRPGRAADFSWPSRALAGGRGSQPGLRCPASARACQRLRCHDGSRMDADAAEGSENVAQHAAGTAREHAERLSSVLIRTAEVMEQSAALADQHADRRERAGRTDDAALEHEIADRAREAAGRARANANEYLRLAGSRQG